VVARIVHDECASCHSPGGAAADRPLTTLKQVQTYAGPALNQVAACKMPQGGSMPAADRDALLAWLVCGAKDD
jgi:mono/diheme cytochrome c family protein